MDREEAARELARIAAHFEQRMEGASTASRNKYWSYAETARQVAAMIRSDGETIREYEELVDGMEDDGR